MSVKLPSNRRRSVRNETAGTKQSSVGGRRKSRADRRPSQAGMAQMFSMDSRVGKHKKRFPGCTLAYIESLAPLPEPPNFMSDVFPSEEGEIVAATVVKECIDRAIDGLQNQFLNKFAVTAAAKEVSLAVKETLSLLCPGRKLRGQDFIGNIAIDPGDEKDISIGIIPEPPPMDRMAGRWLQVKEKKSEFEESLLKLKTVSLEAGLPPPSSAGRSGGRRSGFSPRAAGSRGGGGGGGGGTSGLNRTGPLGLDRMSSRGSLMSGTTSAFGATGGLGGKRQRQREAAVEKALIKMLYGHGRGGPGSNMVAVPYGGGKGGGNQGGGGKGGGGEGSGAASGLASRASLAAGGGGGGGGLASLGGARSPARGVGGGGGGGGPLAGVPHVAAASPEFRGGRRLAERAAQEAGRDRLLKLYEEANADNDDRLTAKELLAWLGEHGAWCKNAELKPVLDEMGVDGRKGLTFAQFYTLVRSMLRVNPHFTIEAAAASGAGSPDSAALREHAAWARGALEEAEADRRRLGLAAAAAEPHRHAASQPRLSALDGFAGKPRAPPTPTAKSQSTVPKGWGASTRQRADLAAAHWQRQQGGKKKGPQRVPGLRELIVPAYGVKDGPPSPAEGEGGDAAKGKRRGTGKTQRSRGSASSGRPRSGGAGRRGTPSSAQGGGGAGDPLQKPLLVSASAPLLKNLGSMVRRLDSSLSTARKHQELARAKATEKAAAAGGGEEEEEGGGSPAAAARRRPSLDNLGARAADFRPASASPFDFLTRLQAGQQSSAPASRPGSALAQRRRGGGGGGGRRPPPLAAGAGGAAPAVAGLVQQVAARALSAPNLRDGIPANNLFYRRPKGYKPDLLAGDRPSDLVMSPGVVLREGRSEKTLQTVQGPSFPEPAGRVRRETFRRRAAALAFSQENAQEEETESMILQRLGGGGGGGRATGGEGSPPRSPGGEGTEEEISGFGTLPRKQFLAAQTINSAGDIFDKFIPGSPVMISALTSRGGSPSQQHQLSREHTYLPTNSYGNSTPQTPPGPDYTAIVAEAGNTEESALVRKMLQEEGLGEVLGGSRSTPALGTAPKLVAHNSRKGSDVDPRRVRLPPSAKLPLDAAAAAGGAGAGGGDGGPGGAGFAARLGAARQRSAQLDLRYRPAATATH